MATQLRDPGFGADPLDVSRSELYRDDTWAEPFARLRREAPVHRCAASDYGAYWSVASYAGIVEVESLPDLYSSEAGGITLAEFNEGTDVRMPMFIARDRPVHTAQRRTVSPAFSPSAMAALAGDIRARTADVLDSLPVGERFDWVERVSVELTTQMLAILFDFPWDERAKLTYWSDWAGDIELAKTQAGKERRRAVMYECGARFGQLWAERAAAPPRGDLISMMAHSDAMGGMDHLELIGNLILLIVGGNDTSRNTMSALAWGLHLFPDARAQLEEEPALIPNAVQEVIRWQTPLAHMRRTATRDAELMERRIARGDRLALWYISGNRDQAVFGPDADAIRVDRPNARRHLAFGHGIHRCIGARLAELQVGILVEELQRRRLRVHAMGEPERVAACFVHGYRHLAVELERY